MDDEDRAPYNQKANPGSSSKPKLDCRNRPLQETDPEEAEKQKLREETEKSIDSLLKKNSIQGQFHIYLSFYFNFSILKLSHPQIWRRQQSS